MISFGDETFPLVCTGDVGSADAVVAGAPVRSCSVLVARFPT